MIKRFNLLHLICVAALAALSTGCHQPTTWSYTGPRVYLIRGTPHEQSDSLFAIRDQLLKHEINAAVYSPDDWLKIVVDIDADPDEEAILVGHGHGAFLATQVARHYAQHHKTKHIKEVICVDAFNKDWPHRSGVRQNGSGNVKPDAIPVGHNVRRVYNYVQRNPQSDTWGSPLVSTRDSNIAEDHPYYWYDHYWNDRPILGQTLEADLSSTGVAHENIDNYPRLVDRIVSLCRRAALTPCHYTPVRHHPHVSASSPVGRPGTIEQVSAAR
ncbi:MAG: hypothetical protein U1A27_14580 [Phycisphaerae bacterium]